MPINPYILWFINSSSQLYLILNIINWRSPMYQTNHRMFQRDEFV